MAEKPYLAAAFLCERILHERDGVLTAIRIVDTFNVTLPPSLPPDAKPVIQITGLLSFKKSSPGAEAERHQAELRLRMPSGREHPPAVFDVLFKPEEMAGANQIVQMNIGVEEFGLHWLAVLLDGEPITRIPFRLLPATISPPETIH